MSVRSPFTVASLCIAALAAVSLPAVAQMNPVALTGFNRDVIVENTASMPYTMHAQPFDVGNNYAWYENGLPATTKGVAQGGTFSSIIDPTTIVQLAPFDQPNALFLDAGTPSGTLSFEASSQVAYDTLAIVASSAGGGGVGTLVITFTDSSTTGPINFNAQDWFFVTTNNAANNLGRMNLNTNAADDGSAGNPRFYHTTINLAALGFNSQAISSITFTKPASGSATAVFAVSGQRAVTDIAPVEATGWNRDIVVENTAVPPYIKYAESFDTFNGVSWYENGLPGTTKGLPMGGTFVSLSNPYVRGQFQPYDAPNALFLDSGMPTASLEFSPLARRPYDFLAVFASSSNGGGLGTLVVHFIDGSVSDPIRFNAQDWFNVTNNNALNNLGRIGLGSGVVEDGSSGNPRVYQTIIDLASLGYNDRAVAGINFTKPDATGAQNTIIMGVSGQVVPGITGACTFPDGTCGLLPEDVCTSAGGSYGGDKSSCPLTGACIAPNGDCSLRTSANCDFVGGTFLGEGVTCPATGSCIAANGDCTILNSYQCDFQGGMFLGTGAACPTAGACCIGDTCIVLNSYQCDFQNGAFQGEGSICSMSYGKGITFGGGAFDDIFLTSNQVTTWIGGVDDGYAVLPIGFSFPFFNGSYTEVSVSTNGYLTFGSTSSNYQNICLPTATAPNNSIYPLWDDYHLHTGHTGRVLYETRKSPNCFIVQWDLIGHYNNGNVPVDQNTFQVVLFEDGNIEMRYGAITPPATCGESTVGTTVGIENAAGDTAHSYDAALLGKGFVTLSLDAVSPCKSSCRADFNTDGVLNSQDFFDFLNSFFGNSPNADYNTDGAVNSQDFFDFLNDFFRGC